MDGEIHALQGMCTHQNLPLDSGEVEDGVLTCEWHGAQFDVCGGGARTLPATRGLKTYETRVEGGRIYLLLPDTTAKIVRGLIGQGESTEQPG